MSGRTLVICDSEIEYATRLADYLNSKKELAFHVKVCDKPEQVEMIRQESGINILIADERIAFPRQALQLIPHKILLSSSLSVVAQGQEKNLSGDGAIYRYQPAKDIYLQLLQVLADGDEGESWGIHKKERGRMIGIYSPVKRVGQTAFAISKSVELSKKANVLYLNLEAYAGFGGYFPEEKERNLSMLLYYAKQEVGNPGLILTTLVKQMRGIDYVPPAVFPEDIKTVTVSEWMWLFEAILNRSIYDVLVLDLGDSVQGLFDIMKACESVYLPTAEDKIAKAKIRQYEEVLCRQGYTELWERMIRCDIRRTAQNESIREA